MTDKETQKGRTTQAFHHSFIGLNDTFMPSTRSFLFNLQLNVNVSLKPNKRHEAVRLTSDTGPWFGSDDLRLQLSAQKAFSSGNESYAVPDDMIPQEFGLCDVEVLIIQGKLGKFLLASVSAIATAVVISKDFALATTRYLLCCFMNSVSDRSSSKSFLLSAVYNSPHSRHPPANSNFDLSSIRHFVRPTLSKRKVV